MAATIREFLTVTPVDTAGADRAYGMNGVGVSGGSLTKASQAALAVGTLLVQMAPEATVSAANTVPAAPATWNRVGWITSVPLDALSDGGTTRAATVPVILSWTSSTAGSVTFTVILFADNAEIGRGTLTAATTTAAAPYTVNVTVNAGVSFPANATLGMSVYALLPANVGVSAVTYTLNYGTSATTGTNIAPVTYSINAGRTGSESTSQTDSARSNGSSYQRTASDSHSSTQTASRVAAYARTAPDSTTATETAIRNAIFAKTGADTMPTMVDTGQRQQASFRRGTDNQIPQADTAIRQIIKNLTSSDATSQTDVASKTITYQRVTLYQFQPGDEPASAQTRHIQGVVYNSDGVTPYLGGANLLLVREDGIVVQTQVSSTVDGSYSFPRNLLDTHTYTVVAHTFITGSPYQAVTPRALTPV
jgi:hypothetical protein